MKKDITVGMLAKVNPLFEDMVKTSRMPPKKVLFSRDGVAITPFPLGDKK